MNATLHEALEAARHELVTLHGLIATDQPNAYEEALREGCDANAARECQAEASWVVDTSAVRALLDAVIAQREGMKHSESGGYCVTHGGYVGPRCPGCFGGSPPSGERLPGKEGP